MEKLTLRSGRYIPRTMTDAEARIKALETHLASLTAELEHILAELNTMVSGLDGVHATSDDASTSF